MFESLKLLFAIFFLHSTYRISFRAISKDKIKFRKQTETTKEKIQKAKRELKKAIKDFCETIESFSTNNQSGKNRRKVLEFNLR